MAVAGFQLTCDMMVDGVDMEQRSDVLISVFLCPRCDKTHIMIRMGNLLLSTPAQAEDAEALAAALINPPLLSAEDIGGTLQ
jgi:hypothetical protein